LNNKLKIEQETKIVGLVLAVDFLVIFRWVYAQQKKQLFGGICPPPHHGLPPCRGGGAYAPMTWTIFNLKERS